MKTIKIFSLASALFILSIFSSTFSYANVTDFPNTVSVSESDHVEYVYIDGVKYKYTYTDDGRIIISESED
ncbi:MAG: hypothetical protein JST55_09135 [Bacteroidetes bacterium]|nr:hypothetical protein [Bacteroidota bacterium]